MKSLRKALMVMVLVLTTVLSVNGMSTTAQAAHKHTYKVVSVKKATYKKAGKAVYKCTGCKKQVKKQLKKLVCKKHNFKVKVTKKATTKRTGKATYTCKNCGKKVTKTLPKLTKKVADNKAANTSANVTNTKVVNTAAANAAATTVTAQPQVVLSAETTETPKATTAAIVSENVSGMYGNGQDVTFTMNGKTVTGHYEAKASMELVSLLNNYRQSKGLAPLATKSVLTSAAMKRSQEITIVFDHKRPDGSKWSTVSAAVSGENIAAGYTSAQGVMKGWVNSPSHNANMLNEGFVSIGISVFSVKTDYGYFYYAVQSFGRS